MSHPPARYILTPEGLAAQRVVNISADFDAISRGFMFNTSSYQTSIADGGEAAILLRTGDLTLVLSYEIDYGGECKLELIEDPSVSSTGSSLNIYNLNRESSNTTGTLAYENPTYSGGTVLIEKFLPGGSKEVNRVGAGASLKRWRIKPNSDYILKVVNNSGAAIDVSITAEWEVK